MKGTGVSRMMGAVVGKALGSLELGAGVIQVLVTLQMRTRGVADNSRRHFFTRTMHKPLVLCRRRRGFGGRARRNRVETIADVSNCCE